MTRVTPLPRDLAKLTRSLGSTVAAPCNSQRLNSGSRALAAKLRLRKDLENGIAEVPASERTLTTTHRPTNPLPSSTRTIPLMQSFHTSPRPSARADTSTIDFAFLPVLDAPSSADPLWATAALRMPLLPDNVAPSRAPTLFAPEAVDEPLQAPQIVVMAADPAAVNAVSALTEVEGMGPDGIELRFGFGRGGVVEDDGGEEVAGGMLTDLWKGIVDDVLGAQKGKVAM